MGHVDIRTLPGFKTSMRMDERVALVEAHYAAQTAQEQEQVQVQDKRFERILELEFTVKQGTALLPLQVNRATAERGLKADKVRLAEAIDALSLDELKAFGDYRRVNKWW